MCVCVLLCWFSPSVAKRDTLWMFPKCGQIVWPSLLATILAERALHAPQSATSVFRKSIKSSTNRLLLGFFACQHWWCFNWENCDKAKCGNCVFYSTGTAYSSAYYNFKVILKCYKNIKNQSYSWLCSTLMYVYAIKLAKTIYNIFKFHVYRIYCCILCRCLGM